MEQTDIDKTIDSIFESNSKVSTSSERSHNEESIQKRLQYEAQGLLLLNEEDEVSLEEEGSYEIDQFSSNDSNSNQEMIYEFRSSSTNSSSSSRRVISDEDEEGFSENVMSKYDDFDDSFKSCWQSINHV